MSIQKIQIERDLIESILSNAKLGYFSKDHGDRLRKALAEQHQGEPVALECWSCKAGFTLSERADCDGCCWKCGVEIDLHGYVEKISAEVERLRLKYEVVAEDSIKQHMEIQTLRTQLAKRDALLCELAEAAEEFSCSAHCETSEAGDALELLNTILVRVNAHKAPKCRVCGNKLHAEGYCSFRDCGVPGKGTKALSVSAEQKQKDPN